MFGETELMELTLAIATGQVAVTTHDCLDVFYKNLGESGLTHAHDLWGRAHHLSQVQGWASSPTIDSLVGTASKYLVPVTLLIADPEAAARQAANFGFEVHSVPGRSMLKVESQLLQSLRVTMERGLAAPAGETVPTLAQIGATFSLRSLDFVSAFPQLSERYALKIRQQARRIAGLQQ